MFVKVGLWCGSALWAVESGACISKHLWAGQAMQPRCLRHWRVWPAQAACGHLELWNGALDRMSIVSSAVCPMYLMPLSRRQSPCVCALRVGLLPFRAGRRQRDSRSFMAGVGQQGNLA